MTCIYFDADRHTGGARHTDIGQRGDAILVNDGRFANGGQRQGLPQLSAIEEQRAGGHKSIRGLFPSMVHDFYGPALTFGFNSYKPTRPLMMGTVKSGLPA